jgi:hypothetical protein
VPERRHLFASLALFLLAVTYPSWRAIAVGTRPAAPRLARSRLAGACVEPAETMRASHMKLLADWRDLAVRRGVRSVTARDGRTWKVSLSGTCLTCHEKAAFCDRCHDYAGARPDCWTCHVDPAGAGLRPGGPS